MTVKIASSVASIGYVPSTHRTMMRSTMMEDDEAQAIFVRRFAFASFSAACKS